MTLMNRDFVTRNPATAGENPRVVLYVRVGADARGTRAVGGLSTQRETYREWCGRYGFEVAEAGESG